MTFKQDQGHQIWYKLVDSEQGYNHAKFEIPSLHSVREKASVKVFCQMRKYVSYLP